MTSLLEASAKAMMASLLLIKHVWTPNPLQTKSLNISTLNN